MHDLLVVQLSDGTVDGIEISVGHGARLELVEGPAGDVLVGQQGGVRPDLDGGTQAGYGSSGRGRGVGHQRGMLHLRPHREHARVGGVGSQAQLPPGGGGEPRALEVTVEHENAQAFAVACVGVVLPAAGSALRRAQHGDWEADSTERIGDLEP